MFQSSLKSLLIYFFITILFSKSAYSVIITDIDVDGNNRISQETIKMFSNVKIGDDLSENAINEILKKLYGTNYFEDVSLKLKDGKLFIIVKENPIIENINYNGIKSDTLKEKITKNLNLRSRSSYNEILLKKDKDLILSKLKEAGYYFSELNVEIIDLKENKVDLNFNVKLNDKAKIKRISFQVKKFTKIEN